MKGEKLGTNRQEIDSSKELSKTNYYGKKRIKWDLLTNIESDKILTSLLIDGKWWQWF